MYRSNANSVVKHYDFILLDMVCLILAFLCAYALRLHAFWGLFKDSMYVEKLLIVIVMDLIAVVFTYNYKGILYRGYFIEFLKTLSHVSIVTAGLLAFSFFEKDIADLSRLIILWFYLIALLLIYLERILWKKHVKHRMQTGDQRRLLLVGTLEDVEAAIQKFHTREILDFQMIGIILLRGNADEIDGVPVVAREFDESVKYLSENVVDGVFFAAAEKGMLPQKLILQCEIMGITVHVSIQAIDELLGVETVEKIGGVPVISSSIRIVTAGDMLLKRILDILGGIVGVILTGIILLFVAPILYISDPGPIFFKQVRIGKSGRKFTVYKIRSMYQDAEARKKDLMDQNEMSGFMFKMENDPRVIGSGPDGTKHGIGWFIRTSSIDEFPQFWNVLKGDMSLVGTRPPTVEEWEQYAPHHRARMRVKPGITGMWQVSGRSEITDFEEVVRLDTEYIQNWNLGMDIKIIFKTILVVFQRKGSK